MTSLAKSLLVTLSLTVALACAGCSAPEPVFHAREVPTKLSEWGMLVRAGGELHPNVGVTPYDLNTALFSDYAHKLRTVWMPEGTSAQYREVATFEFPVGTVITKTFFYPIAGSSSGDSSGTTRVLRTAAPVSGTSSVDLATHRLIETRVLALRETGWISLPYVWNEDQTEATLQVIGASVNLELVDPEGTLEPVPFRYAVPDSNQCSGCHTTNLSTKELEPIGPKARHLDRDFVYSARDSSGPENQIDYWSKNGLLTGTQEPPLASAFWTGNSAALERVFDSPQQLNHLARSYLDVNCAHCHNAAGPADTSGLILDPSAEVGFKLGICKPPVAAGRGTGGLLYAIFPGKSAESIMTHRMNSVEPAIAMPELGRGTVHAEGVELLNAWIDSLPGDC